MKKLKIGDMLVKEGLIKQEDLNQALLLQKKSNEKLGNILLSMELISEDELLAFLSKQLNIPIVDLSIYPIQAEILKEFPESFARRYKMMPIALEKGEFVVAASDPTDLAAYDALNAKLQKPLKLTLAKPQEIIKALDKIFQRQDDISIHAGAFEKSLNDGVAFIEEEDFLEDTPIKKLLNSLLEKAVAYHASDIHIEPDENCFRIRQRIDGVLSEEIMTSKNILPALVLKIKLISGLNISENRLPQDGRFTLRVNDKKIDIRVATMPVQSGESVVMRILDQSTGVMPLNSLGMSEAEINLFKRNIYYPHGMVLVTGPTGCGKTTTLYSALSEINTPEKKIITVEDPVEYSLGRINQIQVKPKIGLEFSTILRAALRQDPDIMLVGEIRDNETADIALKAAMTGHLVFSTVHTFNAISAPIRLMDMGVKSFVIGSAVKLIVSQRLLRKVCPHCKVTYTPTKNEAKWIEMIFGYEKGAQEFVIGKGCKQCFMTGFHGRFGIYEMLEIKENTAEALRTGNLNDYVKLAKETKSFSSLMVNGYERVISGQTTLSEYFKIVSEVNHEDMKAYEEIPLSREKSSGH